MKILFWIFFSIYGVWNIYKCVLLIYEYLNYDRIKKKIHKALWAIAEKENLPIFIKQEKDMLNTKGILRAGVFHYYILNGKYDPLSYRYIDILEKYRDDCWVLAHEIGHCKSLSSSNSDCSEEAADKAGKQLVLQSLSLIERLAMKAVINIYFGDK